MACIVYCSTECGESGCAGGGACSKRLLHHSDLGGGGGGRRGAHHSVSDCVCVWGGGGLTTLSVTVCVCGGGVHHSVSDCVCVWGGAHHSVSDCVCVGEGGAHHSVSDCVCVCVGGGGGGGVLPGPVPKAFVRMGICCHWLRFHLTGERCFIHAPPPHTHTHTHTRIHICMNAPPPLHRPLPPHAEPCRQSVCMCMAPFLFVFFLIKGNNSNKMSPVLSSFQ